MSSINRELLGYKRRETYETMISEEKLCPKIIIAIMLQQQKERCFWKAAECGGSGD